MWNKCLSWLISLVRRDFWRKLIALGFALMVYLGVEEKLAEEQRISGVPVEIALPPELIDMEPQAHHITVTVRASKLMMKNLTGNDLRVTVPVSYKNFVAGQPYTVHLTPELFRKKGVRVVAIDPGEQELVLNLQRRKSRNATVRAVLESENLSRDYTVGEVRCIPSEVQLTGPEQLINDLEQISTLPVKLDPSVTESFEYTASLKVPAGVISLPTRVTVQVDIVKNVASRTFKALPVGLLIEPGAERLPRVELLGASRVEVTVSGLEQTVSELPREEVKPYLDLAGLTEPGVYTVAVKCYVKGDRIDVRSIYPEEIQVKITK